MSARLDDLMNDLRHPPTPAALDVIEAGVWREIDRVRDSRTTTSLFLPVQAAALVAALGLGVAGGTFAAAAAQTPNEISAFSPAAHLAPSTLLDERG